MRWMMLLGLILVGAHAQSGYCSDECMGDKSERLPPMEFHMSLPHSVEHYRAHPQERARMLRRCQEAFHSTLKINVMTKTFKRDCANAQQASLLDPAP
ncbi:MULTISPECIES: hypothetical protein [Helicobacter]|uniref:hypothetical protein n=1 Tax=Helicobacter TaxID=209 RepID=UPI000EAEC786|nr:MULTISPECIES: hypothetical protein [Helicobacter]